MTVETGNVQITTQVGEAEGGVKHISCSNHIQIVNASGHINSLDGIVSSIGDVNISDGARSSVTSDSSRRIELAGGFD